MPGRPTGSRPGWCPPPGYPFLSYRVKGLERRPSLDLVKAVAVDTVAPAACLRILRKVRPDVVFGAGGYVSGPMLAVAAGLRIPRALLEVDAHMGMANRMASPLVRRVFLSFPIEGLRPPHNVLTGRPVPRAVLEATREQGLMELGIAGDRKVVLVIGGSLGARTLNVTAADAWAADDPGFTVVNVTGARDFALIAQRATPHYRVIEFVQSLGAAARRRRPGRVARRRLGVRDRRRGAALAAGAVAQRDQRPPDARMRPTWPTAAPRS